MKLHNGAIVLLSMLAVFGCKDKDTGSIPTDDTGDTDPITGTDDTGDTADTGDTGDTVPCEVALVETEPIYGNTSWFYRDAVSVVFDGDASTLASFTATDGDGGDVALSVEWDDTGFNATVIGADGAWAGSTSYTFVVDVCSVNTEVAFTTTAYGEDLKEDYSSLIDSAYYFDMSRATYTQPPGVGALMALYLDQPLLLGVIDANESELTLMGAQGVVNNISGEITQDLDYATWDFGVADFTESPYFTAAGETVFEYDGIEIPVYSFEIEGTFSADGSTIGGASFQGLGDTRNMGPLLNLGNSEGAVCELVGKYGISCEACPDSNVYCLTIAGDFEDAELLPDVTLEVVVPKEE